jgi:hypothetical protein
MRTKRCLTGSTVAGFVLLALLSCASRSYCPLHGYGAPEKRRSYRASGPFGSYSDSVGTGECAYCGSMLTSGPEREEPAGDTAAAPPPRARPRRETPPPPASTPGDSYLHLTSNVAGVDIFLDDVKVGTIASNDEEGALLTRVKSGQHLIEARKENYKRDSLTVQLKENGVFKHRFELHAVAGFDETPTTTTQTKQARGNLTILTVVKGLRVVVDGKEVAPPTELAGVPAGSYKLIVKQQGRSDREVSITVKDGQTTIVDLDK